MGVYHAIFGLNFKNGAHLILTVRRVKEDERRGLDCVFWVVSGFHRRFSSTGSMATWGVKVGVHSIFRESATLRWEYVIWVDARSSGV